MRVYYATLLKNGDDHMTNDSNAVSGKRHGSTDALNNERSSAGLFYGVGDTNGLKYKSSPCSHVRKAYQSWFDMLKRCYSGDARYARYIGVTVCDEWHNLKYFSEWFLRQPNSAEKNYVVDKDIVGTGLLYSPEMCVIIPQSINNVLNDSRAAKGELPTGVSRNKLGYMARIMRYSTRVSLGTFSTIEEAERSYNKAKKDYLLDVSINQSIDIPSSVRDALRAISESM